MAKGAKIAKKKHESKGLHTWGSTSTKTTHPMCSHTRTFWTEELYFHFRWFFLQLNNISEVQHGEFSIWRMLDNLEESGRECWKRSRCTFCIASILHPLSNGRKHPVVNLIWTTTSRRPNAIFAGKLGHIFWITPFHKNNKTFPRHNRHLLLSL